MIHLRSPLCVPVPVRVRACVQVSMRVRTCASVCLRVRLRARVQVCLCLDVHTCARVPLGVSSPGMCACMCVVHVHVCMCMCASVCTRVCVPVHGCVGVSAVCARAHKLSDCGFTEHWPRSPLLWGPGNTSAVGRRGRMQRPAEPDLPPESGKSCVRSRSGGGARKAVEGA